MTESVESASIVINPLQPTVNIGCLGNVSDGKSSCVRAVTGEQTSRNDSRCSKKNITVQVGYSNAKIYRCTDCEPPQCYASCEGSLENAPACRSCGWSADNMVLVQHLSFVDCPGHECLMRNMISGSSVMDGALVVIAANATVPGPQTAEHLVAADITGIKRYIILQNKVDLLMLGKEASQGAVIDHLRRHRDAIVQFIAGTSAEHAPIVPTSLSPASTVNVDVLLQYLATHFPPNPQPAPFYKPFGLLMHCIRSFDINKPGTQVEQLKGGVIGGTIMTGTLRVGDEIEIVPGLVQKDRKTGEIVQIPLRTRVVSLFTGKTPLKEAVRGGLIGIGTLLDPTLTRTDRMVGMCIGRVGSLPRARQIFNVKVRLLKFALGMASDGDADGQRRQFGDLGGSQVNDTLSQERVKPMQVGEMLQIAIGAGSQRATVVTKLAKNVFTLKIRTPACVLDGQPMTLSRSVRGSLRIIGQAHLVNE